MPRVRASLPDPSGIGFFVMLLAICALVALNSVATTAIYYLLSASGLSWLQNARLGQPLLLLGPLILLTIELWLGSALRAMLLRRSAERR